MYQQFELFCIKSWAKDAWILKICPYGKQITRIRYHCWRYWHQVEVKREFGPIPKHIKMPESPRTVG
ncbi:MAG: hypothetical protein WCJ74_02655 [bacterium]